MMKPDEIIDLLGVEQLAKAVGVTPKAIKVQRRSARLPCKWAPEARKLASQLSPPLFLPDEVFTFASKRRSK